MYFLHQYASIYPLLDEDESTPRENVEFEQAFLCCALLSLALKAAFQNQFLEFVKVRTLVA